MNKNDFVLIVDDDRRNIFALSAVLKTHGYQVIAANDMKEAFRLLENNTQVGVLLLDMMMPEMDGYEALAALRAHEDYTSLPVIAVTAQAMAGDREKCIAAGANEYLSKPVDIDALLLMLQTV